MNSETKACQNCKQNFEIASEDFDFYKKIDVPAPTFCPTCRLQRRYSWRNMRSLYKRPCGLCKKDGIGVYSPDKPHNVFCSPCWWSDGWEGLDYGRDYDFSKPFFEQFNDLLKTAPLLSRFVYEDTMVNSDYASMAHELKNCYLAFNAGTCENSSYCVSVESLKECFDILYGEQSELCYECVNINNCYRLAYSKDSSNCRNSYFLSDCVDCSDCFGCSGLRSKSYYIFNKPYTKESYQEKLSQLGFRSGSQASISTMGQRAMSEWMKTPLKYYHGVQNIDSTGDYVNECKNTKHSFLVRDLEDCKFCTNLITPGKVKDSYDWSQYGGGGELVYDTVQAGEGIYNIRFGWCIWKHTKNSEYGVLNITSSDCFGCVGVKNKQFCILNKQYSEVDYKALRAKIIQHMKDMPYTDKAGRVYQYGEMFPIEISPFCYNETTAAEEFPMTEAQAKQAGCTWMPESAMRGKYTPTHRAVDLPDDIEKVDDSYLKAIIQCSGCSFVYRITAPELAFYRSQKIPLPRFCVECRYKKRFAWQNPMRLRQAQCQCSLVGHTHGATACANQFETSYRVERPEMIYCEPCYNATIL